MTYSQWLGKQEREWFDNRRETIRRAEDGLSKGDAMRKQSKKVDVTKSDVKNLPQEDN